ncbi:hypothetical protein BAE44_0018173 [Dichanthelium oligosanthes]|uniref:RRM domain-containing protein n=1 Tax=Dichanthelium oligosanthes TaxID=888268 RepID=A0A1E5V6S9_9POAL|nr:hypothetical protein BAE44_0018173 [Dichanthelium oligosanthes]
MEPTVHDVLAFHRVDRAAYEHLLSLGAGRHPARDAVALLMWLHRRAGADYAAPRVPALARTPAAAARLVVEARAVLLHGAGAPMTPLLSFLCGEGEGEGEAGGDDDGHHPRGWRRLLLAPCGPAPGDNAARRGVAEVLGGVGALVFDDRLHAILRRYEEDGGDGAALPAELAAPYRLMRVASARAAAAEEEEEDGRSLFITFSKGFPLTRGEVEVFFTERWGDCITKVMMEKTSAGELPSYGRVVFRGAATTAAVLGGRPLVKLMVNGRHMWARKYVHRPPPQILCTRPVCVAHERTEQQAFMLSLPSGWHPAGTHTLYIPTLTKL